MASAPLDQPAAVAAAFEQALIEAARFEGATAPNPPVGAVALDASGAVLACVAHARAGAPHAEAAVLAACAERGLTARVATLVVTLEPCNHHGRTAPCADVILRSPIRSVWIAVADPNPKVMGGGSERLAAAGVTVRRLEMLDHPATPDLLARSRRLIAPFARCSREGRSWITVKQAFTAQGSMIPPPGRKTFTSAGSLELAHRLRRRADAIVTGSGCVLADDPLFTVRHAPDHLGKRRILAILDRRGRVPESYLRKAGAAFEVWRRDDLDRLLHDLAAAGVLEALVEAGPTLTDGLLRRGLWDERVTIRQDPHGGPDRVDVSLREPIPGLPDFAPVC